MEKQQTATLYWLMPVLLSVLAVSVLLAVTVGTVAIPLQAAYSVVFNQVGTWFGAAEPSDGLLYDIIWLLRLPRVLLAVAVGMGLAVCGVIMQAIIKNPLADPYILGVSAGASLGATVAILWGIGVSFGANYIGLCAFGGALLISLGVLTIANLGGRANAVKLLLAGLALSTVCSSFSSCIVFFANDKEGMQTIIYWLMGSLAGAKWSNVQIILPLVVSVSAFFWLQSRILNAMLLGDEAAVTLGLDLHRYRQVYLLLSALIVGFVVYAAGMIGFVGLLIPHVVRMLLGTDHWRVLPVAAISGSIFMVWADVFCRTLLPRVELPIGLLISLIGAPFFVYLMVKKTYQFGGP